MHVQQQFVSAAMSTPRMGRSIFKRFLVTAVTLAAFGLSTHADAWPTKAASVEDDQVSVKVQIGDLDLNSGLGAKAALRRIQVAANTICGGRPSVLDIAALDTYRACIKATVDRTVDSLGNPRIAALNETTKPAIAVAQR